MLAGELRAEGAEVTFACAEAFAHLAETAGVAFTPLRVGRNANTGIARRTVQADAEARRLEEFLEATRAGAVPALLVQARHRRADMLAEPERVLAELRALHARHPADWYVVDQLSYAVTLALHCLDLPYATFCPGHPSYLPAEPGALFGVPYAWPQAVRPAAAELRTLRGEAQANDLSFTSLFSRFIARHAPHRPVPRRAFALCSPHAVVLNYPRLDWLPPRPEGPAYVFTGHLTPTGSLGPGPLWNSEVVRLRQAGRRLVLVALGTFLSARRDVLESVTRGILAECPDTSVILAAGDQTESLSGLAGPRVAVAATVPQQALLRRVDAMVHHGGNNSFTECLAAGVPALVLPFSSDQFSVAHDAERSGAGLCLDSHQLDSQRAGQAVSALLNAPRHGLEELRRHVRLQGPRQAARKLTALMA
ncbi:nucleotide disphospho-sugar-binding domain-containing protein [Streptomyces sp. SPB4]|uniref:nucleotide disphospho-sugar-binding domain-containing protein n=1 Tax=Streptomyces sp. SPB4 TaxID=2940553 RepID=UPI002476F638|nr:nucleotide disphospho-sugar-binding domain-containing protein [Streptomyces sp. SPB4]